MVEIEYVKLSTGESLLGGRKVPLDEAQVLLYARKDRLSKTRHCWRQAFCMSFSRL